jgi:hypothetical protein
MTDEPQIDEQLQTVERSATLALLADAAAIVGPVAGAYVGAKHGQKQDPPKQEGPSEPDMKP